MCASCGWGEVEICTVRVSVCEETEGGRGGKGTERQVPVESKRRRTEDTAPEPFSRSSLSDFHCKAFHSSTSAGEMSGKSLLTILSGIFM